MIIEFEINGARVIVSGENLTVSLTQDDAAKAEFVAQRSEEPRLPTPNEIKKLRTDMVMSQAGFGQMLRVSQGTVCKWEIGTDRPSGDVAIRLAHMIAQGSMSQEVAGITALRRWVKAERGRGGRLASELGVTHAAIPQWFEVPADKLVAVEKITGIKRQVLRPDLFEGISA